MMVAVLGHATGRVEQLCLSVNAENQRAVTLYERRGFRVTGTCPNALRIGGRAYDELVMVRAVRDGE